MINESLHKKPVALDRQMHRDLRLDRNARDMTRNKSLNAFFIAAGEFADACKDFPVVWVPAGQDEQGKPQVAPIAVFGLQQGINLCIDAADRWRVRYVPVMLRSYPFAMARTSATEMVLCVDESWIGFSKETGERLFNDDGTPTELTLGVQRQLEQLEMDVERSRLYGAKLLELNLLRDMQFEATLPDGSKLQVNGFLTVDEDKLNALPDAAMLDLARSGLLGLIHAHQISLSNMARLAEWHAERLAAGGEAANS
ncbi:SapC family protein [Aquabacterium sp.]|uniref:SapC family protein n=1 Tax=Aquabacterium sp. TaxID=1872578 RepID=UPI0037835B86